MSSSSSASERHGASLRIYYTVFASLAVLTVITVAVSRIHMAPVAAVILAFMIAISKASLVGAYFMHLKYDSKVLHLMCAVPTILTLMLLIALMPDIGMTKGPVYAGPPEARARLEAEAAAAAPHEEEASDEGEGIEEGGH